MTCAVGKVCTYTLLMTVWSTSDHKEKHVEKKHRLYAELIAELLLLSTKLHVFNFYSDLFLTLCCVMLATSSSLGLTPLTYFADRPLSISFSFSHFFHVVLLQSLCICLRVESIFRGLLLFLIHVLLIWLLFSIKFSVSSSSSLRNSLMSSCHIFLGLPIAL